MLSCFPTDALSSLLADKKLPIISPCLWTSLRLQITYKEEKTQRPAEFCVPLADWACCVEDAEDTGAGFGHRATSIPALQLHPAGIGVGKPSPLLCSRFQKSNIPNIQINCTHDELGLSTLSVAISQEGVSCYNLSDILAHSTVPMVFQH